MVLSDNAFNISMVHGSQIITNKTNHHIVQEFTDIHEAEFPFYSHDTNLSVDLAHQLGIIPSEIDRTCKHAVSMGLRLA